MQYSGFTYLMSGAKINQETLFLIIQSDIENYVEKQGRLIGRELSNTEIETELNAIINSSNKSKAYHEMISKLAGLRNVKKKTTIEFNTTKSMDKDNDEYDNDSLLIDAIAGKSEKVYYEKQEEITEDNNSAASEQERDTDINQEPVTISELSVELFSEETEIFDEQVEEDDEQTLKEILKDKNLYEYLAYKRISDAEYKNENLKEFDCFSINGYKQIASRTIYKNIDEILSNKKRK